MQYNESNMKINYNLTKKTLDYLVALNNLAGSNWFALDLQDKKYYAVALKFEKKLKTV